jgi:hypothetical protein
MDDEERDAIFAESFRLLRESDALLFEAERQNAWREEAKAMGLYREWQPPPQEAQPVQRSAPEVIYKVHEESAPAIATPRAASPGEGIFTETQIEAIGFALSEERELWRKELRQLRSELATLREQQSGKVTILPPKGRDDAAA